MTKAVVDVVAALKAPIDWERFDDVSGSQGGKPAKSVVSSLPTSAQSTCAVCIQPYAYTRGVHVPGMCSQKMRKHTGLVTFVSLRTCVCVFVSVCVCVCVPCSLKRF